MIAICATWREVAERLYWRVFFPDLEPGTVVYTSKEHYENGVAALEIELFNEGCAARKRGAQEFCYRGQKVVMGHPPDRSP